MLSRTGITMVTSRCDGPLAGRGWATVASSSVRASCALTASCTSSRPPLSMVCAAGAKRSSRVGRTAEERGALAEHLHPAIHLHGEPVGQSRSRHVSIPSRSGTHLVIRCKHPSTISAKMRSPSSAVAVVGIAEHTQLTHRGHASAAHAAASDSASGALLPGSRSSIQTSFGEICSNTDVSVWPACASAFATVHEHQPTSRPSY